MFTNNTFKFLKELKADNNRDWFTANKDRYEELVREPALAYISDMADPLAKISPHFIALAKKTGGSMMRVHRDIRFSKDKTPYKTNIGIHFRHAAGKDVHAPGFYLHVEPGDSFIAAGIYHPDNSTLNKVRTLIDEYPEEWKKLKRRLINDKTGFSLHGESLKKAPRGFAPDHPLLEDLKRKHFIAVKPLNQKEITSKSIIKDTTALYKKTAPLVEFICDACDQSY